MEKLYIGDKMSVFDKSGIDEIIDKVKKDKTGRMSQIMQEIMKISERAGKFGFTMKDLSIIVTTGWYLSQSPELKSFFDELINMPPPSDDKDDDVWN